jgi:hypothetical protein
MRPFAKRVAVLFARSDSIYKAIAECDVWDAGRDARKYRGDLPIIAHPPCRAWGRLRGLATIIPEEKALGPLAVSWVRRNGGVLEHPAYSTLWPECDLPGPGKFDVHGGFTIQVRQSWWGHRADKLTWLYVLGVTPDKLPQLPLSLLPATELVTTSRKRGRRKIPLADREHTPARLARWLVEVAIDCGNVERPFVSLGSPDLRLNSEAVA